MGIEDDGEVTGHGYSEEAVRQMLAVPQGQLEPPQQPGFRVRVGEKELLVFDVLASSVPVQVKGEGYPLRIGDQTVLARLEQIEGIKFQGLMGSFEGRASSWSVGDLDEALIQAAKEGAGLQGLSDEEYLNQRRLGDWRGDRFVLRQAAELLFAKGLPDHPNAGVRVFRVVGRVRRVGLEDNVEEVERIEGPLPMVLDEVYRVIAGLMRYPSRLTPGGKFKKSGGSIRGDAD